MLPDGTRHTFQVLIDTGAQTNAIRSGLLPAHMFKLAAKPITMVTASGALLPGGRSTIDLILHFQGHRADGSRIRRPFAEKVTLYDVAIGCDIILGYAWLREPTSA